MSGLRLLQGGTSVETEKIDHESALIERYVADFLSTRSSERVSVVNDKGRAVEVDFESRSFQIIEAITKRLLSGEKQVLGTLNLSPKFVDYVARRFGDFEAFFQSQVWVNLLIESFRRVYVEEVSAAVAYYKISADSYEKAFLGRLGNLQDGEILTRDGDLEMDVNSIKFQISLMKSLVLSIHEICSSIGHENKGVDNLMGFPYVMGSRDGYQVYEDRMINHAIKLSENEGSMATIFCDIDGFKGYNSVYGYAWANRVLKKVAEISRQSLRGSDEKFRYGGEEIVFFIPGANLVDGEKAAERLRSSIEESPTYCFAGLKFYLKSTAGENIPLNHDDVFESNSSGEVLCSINIHRMHEVGVDVFNRMEASMIDVSLDENGEFVVNNEIEHGLSPMILQAVGKFLSEVKGLRPQDEFRIVVEPRKKSIALVTKSNITISLGVNSFRIPNELSVGILESEKGITRNEDGSYGQLGESVVGFFNQAISHAAGKMNTAKADGKNCVRSEKFE